MAISSSSSLTTNGRAKDEELELIQIADSLNFGTRPRFALKICFSSAGATTTELFGTREIDVITLGNTKRVSESMKLMMVYIATKHLNYNSKNEYTIKEQRQILNAARRLVCYSEGFHEPKGDPPQLEL